MNTSTATGTTGTGIAQSTGARIGVSAPRPDGIAKVKGEFEFSSDLWAEGMLWAHILRSPHASARIVSIDLSAAWKIVGVRSIVLQDDVLGARQYGLEHQDQPVFAHDVVRFYGEPIAAIAADHPETARRAAEAIVVEYEVTEPLIDAELALTADPIHPDGNVFRHLVIRHGDQDVVGEVIVEGTYEVGMQDQAFLGPESGLAIPGEGGDSIDLHISTQWLHSDLWQVAAALNMPEDNVRLHLAGVGGAFGAREDVSMHIHLCMLALRTGRPVKIVYSRLESFLGHVHRHPAKMFYRHHATKEGKLVRVEARLMFDGGAYMSSSGAVIANAACFATGPYNVPSAHIDGWAVRTNNPSCGAMRGFGAVQTCYGHESQMDKLAAACGLDPLAIRQLNVIRTGDTCITGQVLDGTAPTKEILDMLAAAPLPADTRASDEIMSRPGGAGRTADQHHVKRGVGYALGWKNLMFSEGFDDYSTASCTITNGQVSVKSACAEVGQGFVTIAQQIARTVLGVDDITLEPADTFIGSAGSTSASRQTWMSGGAVNAACEAVRDRLLATASQKWGVTTDGIELRNGLIRTLNGDHEELLAEFTAGQTVHELLEYRHRPTFRLDENGQGDAHVSWAFSAHRAVVDVDIDLGLIKVVDIATTQDTGTILNPLQVIGQIEGGTAQGVGLAVMEEIVLAKGKVRNPSFTDYLIPTALDMPNVTIAGLYTEPETGAPFGAKGVGEPPTISSTPAVASAVRAATGLDLPRVPIRPQDIALARRG